MNRLNIACSGGSRDGLGYDAEADIVERLDWYLEPGRKHGSLTIEDDIDEAALVIESLRAQLAACKSDLATACTLASKSAEQAHSLAQIIPELAKDALK